MIKSLAAISAALVCMTGDITVQKASAAGNYCYQNNNYATVCIHSVFSNKTNNYKIVEWSVDGGNRYEEKIYCNPAHRANYKENLAGIACFQFS